MLPLDLHPARRHVSFRRSWLFVGIDRRMAGWQSLGHGADGAFAGCRLWLSETLCTVRIAASPAPHYPLISLALQNIAHVHARSRGIASFRLKMHCRGGFVLVVCDVGDIYVHREQIGALGEVSHYALAHRIRALDVAFAAAQDGDRQTQSGCDNSEPIH